MIVITLSLMIFTISPSSKADENNLNLFSQLGGDARKLVTHRVGISTQYGKLQVEIHFEKVYLNVAKRVVAVLKHDVIKVINYFQYTPRDTVHIIIDYAISANGSATVIPENIIFLNDFPPLASEHLVENYDWNKGLIVHEMTHLIHLEQTSGILRGLENVFGNVGKIAGLVPRWFTEGLAVWAETEFSDGGRNRNELLKFEFDWFLRNEKACRNIACLDNPGLYPFRQFSYWMGGKFLSFVETLKPGAIRCIVTENSGQVPFFLNRAFKKCVDKTAEEYFQLFHRKYLKEILLEDRAAESVNLMAGFKWFSPEGDWKLSLQGGHHLVGNQLFTIEFERRAQRLTQYDLATRENGAKVGFKQIPTQELMSNLFYASAFDQSKKRIPVAFYGPELYDDRREHRFYSFADDQNKMSPVLYQKVTDGVDYNFSIGENLNWALKFFAGRWSLYEMSSSDKGKWNSKLLWKFDDADMISNVRYLSNVKDGKPGLILMLTKGTNEKVGKFSLVTLSKKSSETSIDDKSSNNSALEYYSLYEATSPFKYYASCSGQHLVKINYDSLDLNHPGQLVLLDNKNIFPVVGSWVNEMVDIKWNDQVTVVIARPLTQKIFYTNKGCSHFIQKWRTTAWPEGEVAGEINAAGNVSVDIATKHEKHEKTDGAEDYSDAIAHTNLDTSNSEAVNPSTTTAETEKMNENELGDTFEIESFPSLRHFRPHYWGLKFKTDFESFDPTIFTSMQDPWFRNRFDILVKYQSDIRKFSPRVFYTYRLDGHFLNIGLDQAYNYNIIFDIEESFEAKVANYGRSHFFGKFFLSYKFKYSLKTTSDFISKRDVSSANATLIYGFSRNTEDAFLKKYSWSNQVIHSDVNSIFTYWGLQSALQFQLNFEQNLKFRFDGIYSFADKKGLSGGLFYGGGATSFSSIGNFEHYFYGIGSKQAYGNQIISTRSEIDYIAFYNYSGAGLLPLFLKETHFTFGINSITTETIFHNKKLYHDKTAISTYLGLRLDITVAYLLPINILYAYVFSTVLGGGDRVLAAPQLLITGNLNF